MDLITDVMVEVVDDNVKNPRLRKAIKIFLGTTITAIGITLSVLLL